jgi:hypothetical protein
VEVTDVLSRATVQIKTNACRTWCPTWDAMPPLGRKPPSDGVGVLPGLTNCYNHTTVDLIFLVKAFGAPPQAGGRIRCSER